MKTKQANMKAVLVKSNSNANNMSREKETVTEYSVIDKKTEKTIVDCRVYMSRSSRATTVYASIWVNGLPNKAGESFHTSGRGSAGGCGYHKESAAIGDAIHSAGIELFGTAYSGRETVNFKTRARIDGVGDSAVRSALLAIAYAAGCKDGIFI